MYAQVPRYEQASDDYHTFTGLAEILGVAKEFTEGRTAADWLRHLYAEWRAGRVGGGAGGLPDFDTFWRDGLVELPEPPPNVLLAGFRADPAGNPLSTPSGRICTSFRAPHRTAVLGRSPKPVPTSSRVSVRGGADRASSRARKS